jgi:hypothetical protein
MILGSDLIPGLQLLFIFSVGSIISFTSYLRFRRGSKRMLASNKCSIIILLLLFASLILVFFNPAVLEYSIGNIRQISDSIANQNLTESALYAIGLGILTSLLVIRLLNRSEDLVSKPTIDQKLLLNTQVFLFVMMLITIGASPLLLIVTTGPSLLNYDVESLKSQIFPLFDFIQGGVSGIIVLLLSYAFSIWIPSALLIYVVYEARASALKLRYKILLIAISLSLLIAIAIWNILGLFVPILDKFSYASILLGPTISAVLLSFLAAEGYIDTIRGGLKKLRARPTASPNENKNNSALITVKIVLHQIGSKALAIIILIITIIGLSRNLFLLSIPFVYVDFPLGYPLIYDYFIVIVSDYVFSVNPSQGLTSAASDIYDYFIVFFSLFWLYDIIMVFRAFGEDFLNSENLIYKKLRTHVGQLTALSFLSIMILFTIHESSFSFRIDEMNAAFPTWVKQELGIQIYEFRFLADLSSQLGLLSGIATLIGIVYVIIRSRPQFKKLLNIGS